MGRRLILLALLVAGCSGTAPTPQIVYVTPAPTASPAATTAPTPVIIYVTPAPTVTPGPVSSGAAGGIGAGLATAPPLRTITGTLTYLGDTVHDIAKKHCQGRLAAIGPGGQVTVRNEVGTVIGIATLSDGTITDAGCVFTFSAPNIPAATFYTFDVAGIPGQPVPVAMIRDAGWKVALTLGG